MIDFDVSRDLLKLIAENGKAFCLYGQLISISEGNMYKQVISLDIVCYTF